MPKDYFGVDCSGLLNKKLFLFDMDGTIYNDNELFDGTIELLDKISKTGGRYVFITNNSSKSVDDYINKVSSMGINVSKEHFFTSSNATVLYLKEKYPDSVVYCQGTKSLVKELKENGINVVCDIADNVKVVLVGFDTELTSEKLKNTCKLLGRDVAFVATNPDLRCPVSFGYVPDCGAICKMLEYATERKPVYIGKPEPTMINIVREKYNCSREETVVIGDRIYTDIASGYNALVDTVCVLSGEATLDDIKNSTIKPVYTIQSVKEIAEIFE